MTNETVLIVEDEAIVAKDIECQLVELGYKVLGIADCYQQTMDIIEKEKPMVILMDIKLKSDMDGITIAGKILEKYQVSIIFLTAHAESDTLERAIAIYPCGYIVKPFTIATLNSAIKLALVKYKMFKSMEDMNESLKIYNFTLSHDLKVPLRHIDFSLGKLKSMKYPSKQYHDHLDSIQTSVNNINDLISQVLKYSALDQHELHVSEISMNEVVSRIISNLQNKNHSYKKIEFTVEELPSSYGDPFLIQQVWANLIDNACKYTSSISNVKIKISTTKKNGKVHYYIKDNGQGLTPSDIKNITTPFYRGSNADLSTGHGLGLSISNKIINLHNGKLFIESSKNEGATFKFYLDAGLYGQKSST